MSQEPREPSARIRFPLPIAGAALLGAGILYFVVLFLPWRRECFDYGPFGVRCGTQNGLAQGAGIIDMLLALAIVVMEVVAVAKVEIDLGTPQRRARLEGGLAASLLVFTILKVLVGVSHIYVWSFVGLALAIAIAYGGWIRWQEAYAGATPRPTPPGSHSS
jgi:hypothetical protein